MLTPRNAIVLAALVFAALVGSSIVSALRPPASPGTGPDSFHLGREGTHALATLLQELGATVERGQSPPGDTLPTDGVLLLIAPDPVLVRTEPEPLHRVAAWVRRGGRVVVAPGFADRAEAEQLQDLAELPHYDADVLSALGLSGVRVELMPSDDIPPTAPDDTELVVSPVADTNSGPAVGKPTELYTLGAALPEVLLDNGAEALWETSILDAQGDERILAAGLAVGAGELVVLSDSTLLSNVALRRGGNARWLAGVILSGGRTRIAIDEFYHGLSVRGNAWWLLTQPAYATLAVCALLWLGLWTWRSGQMLGPPLADAVPTRRALGEYVAAMGRLLLRSQQPQPFLLSQVRAGVWRRLSQELNLPPGGDDLERLVAAAARRDVGWSQQIEAAFMQAEAAAARGVKAQVLPALQALQACVARH